MRTSLQDAETVVWEGYNAIREEEACFRTLKTGLDFRPVYHKKDDASLAHLNLGILAYWVVNTIRFQLKRNENASPVAETKNVDNPQSDSPDSPTEKFLLEGNRAYIQHAKSSYDNGSKQL